MKLLTDAIITTVSLALWTLIYFVGVISVGILLIASPGLFLTIAVILVVYAIKYEHDRG